MARRQRKHRRRSTNYAKKSVYNALKKRVHDQRRKRSIDLRSYGIRLQTPRRQTTLRGNSRRHRRTPLGVLHRTPQKTIYNNTLRRKLTGLRGKVMSSLPLTNTQNSLQAKPSTQSRKEHKCIKKPSSLKAHNGSGAYRHQWKPWCKGK